MKYTVSTAIRFFFFNDTATTEIYTLSLHDALPICIYRAEIADRPAGVPAQDLTDDAYLMKIRRSEEHTSELQSRLHLVCRLLLEKKKYHAARRSRLQQSGIADARVAVRVRMSECAT